MAVTSIGDVVIDVQQLTLDFPAPKPIAASSPKQQKPSADARLTKAGAGKLRILDGISFTARRGDRIGLIGSNGAGKSTILRAIGGIYHPTFGTCRVAGRVSTLFTSALGLNPNATGYENIYIGATLLGLDRQAIKEIVPDIIDFCELGDFMDLPLRTYSAGMRMRLGFAIATCIHPDVLLIDEVFGTGDRQFRDKARQRIENVMTKANVLMLASHSDDVIKTICTKAIWLDRGLLKATGPVDEVLDQYNQATAPAKAAPPKASSA